MHTLGYPLSTREFGGGFVYGLEQGMASIGLVVGLDYPDPLFDPYLTFQRFKQHPLVSELLNGGSRVSGTAPRRCLKVGGTRFRRCTSMVH